MHFDVASFGQLLQFHQGLGLGFPVQQLLFREMGDIQ
jgi:hypothetical protein